MTIRCIPFKYVKKYFSYKFLAEYFVMSCWSLVRAGPGAVGRVAPAWVVTHLHPGPAQLPALAVWSDWQPVPRIIQLQHFYFSTDYNEKVLA